MCLRNHLEADQTTRRLRLNEEDEEPWCNPIAAVPQDLFALRRLVCLGLQVPAPPACLVVTHQIVATNSSVHRVSLQICAGVAPTRLRLQGTQDPSLLRACDTLGQHVVSKRSRIYGIFPSGMSESAVMSRRLPSICYKFHFPTHNL